MRIRKGTQSKPSLDRQLKRLGVERSQKVVLPPPRSGLAWDRDGWMKQVVDDEDMGRTERVQEDNGEIED